MYKPVDEPIKCPDCGEIVEVNTDIVLTSYPSQYQWFCPKCGKTGYINCAAVAFENQTTPPKTRSCDVPAPKFIQQGWECPKCGAVLAPHQNYCPFCSKKESDWITTVGTGIQPLYAEQHTNPNLCTSISINGVPNVPGSCSDTVSNTSNTKRPGVIITG